VHQIPMNSLRHEKMRSEFAKVGLGLAVQNRRAIYRVVKDSFTWWHGTEGSVASLDFNGMRGTHESSFLGRAQPDSARDD